MIMEANDEDPDLDVTGGSRPGAAPARRLRRRQRVGRARGLVRPREHGGRTQQQRGVVERALRHPTSDPAAEKDQVVETAKDFVTAAFGFSSDQSYADYRDRLEPLMTKKALSSFEKADLEAATKTFKTRFGGDARTKTKFLGARRSPAEGRERHRDREVREPHRGTARGQLEDGADEPRRHREDLDGQAGRPLAGRRPLSGRRLRRPGAAAGPRRARPR